MNTRFAQDTAVIHRENGLEIGPVSHDGDMPVRVGNIISPAWLADQMGLPVAEVQERLEKEARNEQRKDRAGV